MLSLKKFNYDKTELLLLPGKGAPPQDLIVNFGNADFELTLLLIVFILLILQNYCYYYKYYN